MLSSPSNLLSQMMIHYTADESLYVPNRHMNIKQDQPYVRTSEATMHKIQQAVTDKFSKSKVIYDEASKKAASDDHLNTRKSIYAPRNIQQAFKVETQSDSESQYYPLQNIFNI